MTTYPLHVHDRTLPTTVIPLRSEETTFVTTEFEGRTFRFCIRGGEAPYEVCFLHEFGLTGSGRGAWFPIDPEYDNELVLQQYLRPQLVELHEAELFRAGAGLPAAG
jgi:hypothetical protein